ncbi:MAG: NB-ARC domain-containing protein [Aulosira sp. ZfuVER01]|nr:NB-ARC domain-containing protein [Aulosira sp. ZfuVER01]MDZ7998341.1 NB-ARC domain-containing protein [Aulosira sp. DedVER01a]MDZ8050118.1 NB-ARC domain-containing protein [Aulosira sp. ZfuCHP01]
MAAEDSHRLEEDFIEAKNNWELEKLYVDLASAKGKALTPVEKKFLRGLLCGCSPAEIAKVVYQSGSSSTVRVYLSNGLYKYIEEMLSNQVGDSVKVKTWSRVTQLLEKAGYKKGWFHLQSGISPIKVNKDMELDLLAHQSTPIQTNTESINTSVFHGRRQELTQVQAWILQERCRVVVILGMGGIGKTAFSVKLLEEIQDQFEYVIWRSLRFAPPLEVLLDQLIQLVSPASNTNIVETLESKISQLIDCLRSHRCLIVLDQVDSILGCSDSDELQENPTVSTDSTGIQNLAAQLITPIRYRQGYEGYGELIRRLGDLAHQSCIIFTSREKPQEIAALEGEELPVRSVKLSGLNLEESILILKAKGLTNKSSKEECKVLIERYAGNPLFLKLVTTTIQELFGGNIAEFIEQGTIVFGDIRDIFDRQFNRLSSLEKHLLYWLSLHPDLISVRDLQRNIILPRLSPQMSQRLILEAMEFLQRRSLIERQTSRFSLNPVLIEYIVERLIEENFQLSKDKDGYSFMSHTIFAEHLKNYIRDNGLNAEI